MDFKIYNLRGQQVMLDSDLAQAYEVSVKALNQAVKRNQERFPNDFCFKLSNEEKNKLVTICDHLSKLKYSYQNPRAFTQEGVASLSGVLKSRKAVQIYVKIMRAFVEMRKSMFQNSGILQRIQEHDIKFLEQDKKFDKIFNSLNKEPPKQGIFYDGQIFDAYEFINNLISKATQKIVLIDNYVNYETLSLFKNTKAQVLIKTHMTDSLKKDYEKYCFQYGNIFLEEFTKSHDRFLIIDSEVYHIGASLKDLGKKWFAFSKMYFLKLD